jgi:AcrR family transcriptional regulator
MEAPKAAPETQPLTVLMPPHSPSPAKYNTPLRQAQRDLTRSRIKNAARTLFYENHYDSTTMDEIALAAGLRRSTVYLHYKDKAGILEDLIADYTPKAKSILAMLPGPHPSLQQLNLWVKKIATFVAKERVPLSIILELRRTNEDTDALENLTRELLSGLGANNPLFREASRDDANPMLRARGLMLLQVLTYACEMHLNDTSDMRGRALLAVAAEDFFDFLSSPESKKTGAR